jgi:glycosyltransferase involved in cell wall biosynthesis
MDTPRIAVVTPCHDDGPLAVEAVKSVQEVEPVELIVVDDGSTDPETKAALAQLEAGGVRVLRKENGGLATARMAGVAATQAPYVQPLDSDDLLPSGVLSLLADALDAHPQAAFAYGDYRVFGDYDGLYRAPERFSRWGLTYANPYCGCSLIRREALLAVGGWELNRAYEDWDLWMKFAEAGYDGVYVPEVVYLRRLHGTRMLGEARDRHQELYRLLQERHPKLFAMREELRAAERPSLKQRLLYPLLLGERKYAPVWLENSLKTLMMRVGIRV